MRNELALLAIVALIFTGCQLPPSATEKLLYDVTTNAVPVATSRGNVVTLTNDTGAIETRNVVTWETNIESHVTYTVSTNGAAMVQTTSRLTNLFAPGFGELVAALGLGALAAWGKSRSTVNKSKAGNVVMAQGIETLLAIVETTPQGKELAEKMKLKLAKEQGLAGVANEIAFIVENYVDNDAAKEAARKVIALLPKPQRELPL